MMKLNSFLNILKLSFPIPPFILLIIPIPAIAHAIHIPAINTLAPAYQFDVIKHHAEVLQFAFEVQYIHHRS